MFVERGVDHRIADPVLQQSPPPTLSFVVPAYGSPGSLTPLAERIKATCAGLGVSYELIFVDDRCPKDSWSAIAAIAEQDEAVVGIRLSRNFGQHAAIQAGLKATRGHWIVVMDCDLQDLPEEVPALLAKAREGWDIVQARRGERPGDHPWRRFVSTAFYRVLSLLTGTEHDAQTACFGIYGRKVIDAITSWDEETKYFPAIVQWIGFSRTGIEVGHGSRHEGRSSYSLKNLVRLAMNIVVGFSDMPLRLLMAFGVSVIALSLAVSAVVVVLWLLGLLNVEGWASIIISMWFLAGCIMFSLGLTGLYVGRILIEAKGRPNYIVDVVVRTAAFEANNAPENAAHAELGQV